ncbi:hypothetical protein [Nibribacter koreensis]|uniref:MORN repeat variant n=1 Tax=Nibribacter koreensis TaxID=1084519 RepID=A0ABP8F6N3_9BACT
MKGFVLPVLLAVLLFSCMSPKTEEVKDMDSNGWVRTKGTLVNGHREGFFEDYDSSGVLIESAFWKQGYREGPFTRYFPNGDIKEKGAYVEGELNGTHELYDSLGNSTWVMYADGMKVGVEEHKDKTRIITDQIHYSENGHALYQEKLSVLGKVTERILFPVMGDNDDVLKLGVANAFTVHLIEPPVGKVTMVIGTATEDDFIPIATGTSSNNQTFTYIFKPTKIGPHVLSIKLKHAKSPQDQVSVSDEVYQFLYTVE